MSIDFSNHDMNPEEFEPLVTTSLTREDENEYSLRPKTLREYIGQEKAKMALSVAVYNHYKRIYFGGAEDVELIAEWAKNEKPDLVVVGPEAPLVKGLVDALEKIGVPAFGPVAAGARMEGSKRFAKELMDAAGVPVRLE